MTPESIRATWNTTYDQLNAIVSFLQHWINSNDLSELKHEIEAITNRLQSGVDSDSNEINALIKRKQELKEAFLVYPKYKSIYDSILNDISSIQPKERKKYSKNYYKAIDTINIKHFSSSISATSKIVVLNFKELTANDQAFCINTFGGLSKNNSILVKNNKLEHSSIKDFHSKFIEFISIFNNYKEALKNSNNSNNKFTVDEAFTLITKHYFTINGNA